MKINLKKLARELRWRYNKKTIRTLRDMKESYSEKELIKEGLKKFNPVVYKVYSKEIGNGKIAALTIINPGKVGKEYYMTKGHKHQKPFSEEYYLIKGQGKLIIQNSKKLRIVNLVQNKKILVPGKSAHRIVNIGKRKLKFLAIYKKNSGHNYNIKFRKRIFAK